MSSRLPSLNLRLGDFQAYKKNENEISNVLIRTDSEMKKHTITLTITDKEIGTAEIEVEGQVLKIPTYQLRVTDDKTEEIRDFQVIRDFPKMKKKEIEIPEPTDFSPFLGISWFDSENYFYENVSFEPKYNEIEKFQLVKHRHLEENQLVYELQNTVNKVIVFSGSIPKLNDKSENNPYFWIIDHVEGQSFIGDILYREKFLKLTPQIELLLIKRKKTPKNIESNNKGEIQRIIYI